MPLTLSLSLKELAKMIAIDLYCGLGGWAEGLLAEGWEVIGYDTEAHDYGTGGYPGTLILQDVLTLHGAQFKDVDLFVASPPCQKYSYMAMPWSRAKAQAAAIRADTSGEERRKLNLLFDACFRIQREASEAAGHHIPMVVENVKGAQPWVGDALANYGSFYLWGDVGMVGKRVVCVVDGRVVGGRGVAPAAKAQKFSILPQSTSAHTTGHTKNDGGSWFNVAHNTTSGKGQNPDGRKIPNQGLAKRHPKSISPQWRAKQYGEAVKVPGIDFNKKGSPGFNVAAAQQYRDGVKFSQTGDAWFAVKPRDKMLGQKGPAAYGSRSNSRKAASAMIAKIPFALAQHVARCYKPESPADAR